MKNLPVVNLKQAERRELLERIDLHNRPRLNANFVRLNEVSAKLASDSFDRDRFVENPAAYLQEQMIPVDSCSLVRQGVGTTEACTVNVICIANVAVVANVMTALTAVNSVFSVNSLWTQTVNSISGVRVGNFGPPQDGPGFGYTNIV